MNNIDWSPFDCFPEDTCYCQCGSVYRSHSKAVMSNGGLTIVSRKNCPGCGKSREHLYKVSSDTEYMTIGNKK